MSEPKLSSSRIGAFCRNHIFWMMAVSFACGIATSFIYDEAKVILAPLARSSNSLSPGVARRETPPRQQITQPFSSANEPISNIAVRPSGPSKLKVNERAYVTFSYNFPDVDAVQIWAGPKNRKGDRHHPFSAHQPSDILPPFGTVTRFFTLTQPGSVRVAEILVHDDRRREIYSEIFLVDFSFE